jgi:hypothetical protein
MYFTGVLVVPDLLVDFQGSLEVRHTLRAILEENFNVTKAKQDARPPRAVTVVVTFAER